MTREYVSIITAAVLISRYTHGFQVAAPAACIKTALQRRQLQQRQHSCRSERQSRLSKCAAAVRSPIANASRGGGRVSPLVVAGGDGDNGSGGGGGEGFSPPEEKASRRSAKKAKARRGAPAIPVGKKDTPVEQSQGVSKAVVVEVLGGQAAGREASSDQVAARKEIERMEKEEQDRIAERKARIDRVLEEKVATEADPSAGSIPEVVSNRMLKRMIPFFLLPALGGVGIFVAVYILAKKYEYTVPAYIVAYATQAPFAVALLGITYAILSSSWDEEREGTFFGVEEAKRNVGNIYDGLKRSSDRMDVEDMIANANEEARKTNRYQRRQMRKNGDE